MIPLATNMTDLLNPQMFTIELAILVLGILSIFLMGGIALRSVLILSTWVFLAMAFVVVIIWQVSFIYFWLVAMFNILAFPIVIVSRRAFNVNL